MNKASCLGLLSNAVLLWNSPRIAEIVNQLRATGQTIADQDLARRVTDHARAQGAILGKAMSRLNEGKGLVLVLVSLQ